MKNYKIVVISAVSLDGVIGIGEEMPWYIPEDFKHFRNTTMGHPLIVGSSTYYTLPDKAFQGREYYVLSRKGTIVTERLNVFTFSSVDALMEHLDAKYPEANDDNVVYLAGGEMIYNLLIDKCDELVITWVGKTYPKGDKKFPIDSIFNDFSINVESEWLDSKKDIRYKIITYKRDI